VSDPKEESWIHKAQRGNREAFAVVVDAYWSRVYRWLYGMTRDSHRAEDLTQEAFLKCWVSLPSYRPGTNFRAWLFRIASNCFLDTRRRAQLALHHPLDDALPTAEPGPVSVALTREITLRIDQEIAQLPEQFRGALLLRIQEDLSYREIAVVFRVTEETARWRVFKAREMLLEKLGPELD